MDSIFEHTWWLMGNSVFLISVMLILVACLVMLAGRRMKAAFECRTSGTGGSTFRHIVFGPASRPADDNSEHRDVLGQLQDRLPTAKAVGREKEPTIVDLLSQIVDVNATLHSRLESAEGTLENQAAEITAYKSEARTDTMTGLANRRVFDEVLAERVANWQRSNVPVTVMLVDVDHFKRFNDNYGHLAGDEVLAQVARVLREAMSDGDLVSRIGGEEFAVITDGDCPRNARSRAEKARRQIEQEKFAYEGQRLQVTVSMGVADAQSGETASALVKRADVALYHSKATGRNLAHWHDGTRLVPLTALAAHVNPASGFATTDVVALTQTQDFGTVCHELRQRLFAVALEEA